MMWRNVTIILIFATGPSYAADEPFRGRRFDDQGRYVGQIREDSRGNYRLFNEQGEFEGTVRPDKRRYDAKGRFSGSFEKEDW